MSAAVANTGLDFRGRRAVVTGASRGIGYAIAELLAAAGAEVVAVARDQARLDALGQRIGCQTAVVDLADADADATRAVARRLQPADLLVNCAGITVLKPFVDTAVEDLQATYATNVVAPMILAQETARSLIARSAGGAIVNVSSIAAKFGTVDHTAYCASKGALDAMMRVMAVELGPHGIRVNNVNPVITLTDMAAQAWSDPAKSGPVLDRIPLGRFVQPEEVASTVAYLLSEAAAMVNGVALDVDGGFHAR